VGPCWTRINNQGIMSLGRYYFIISKSVTCDACRSNIHRNRVPGNLIYPILRHKYDTGRPPNILSSKPTLGSASFRHYHRAGKPPSSCVSSIPENTRQFALEFFVSALLFWLVESPCIHGLYRRLTVNCLSSLGGWALAVFFSKTRMKQGQLGNRLRNSSEPEKWTTNPQGSEIAFSRPHQSVVIFERCNKVFEFIIVLAVVVGLIAVLVTVVRMRHDETPSNKALGINLKPEDPFETTAKLRLDQYRRGPGPNSKE